MEPPGQLQGHDLSAIIGEVPSPGLGKVESWPRHSVVNENSVPGSAAWTYRMAPTMSGTTVTEIYEAMWAPWWMHVLDAVTFRRRQLARHMSLTLNRLKKIVESTLANETTPGDG